MSTLLIDAIAREFGEYPPDEILPQIRYRLRNTEFADVDIAIVVDALLDEGVKALHTRVANSLRTWDAEAVAEWSTGTPPGSLDRRADIYLRLGLPAEVHDLLNSSYPSADRPVVIAAPQPWEPWYDPERRAGDNFYWRAYRRTLEDKRWTDETIGGLDVATTEVVRRLADPTRDEPYQAKGLVVGYVQSGKTANFTGVTAKAIDAGYRLIIVLTGTIELLRSQTQRRIDMELVGRQNIGADTDYAGDPEWSNFLEHEFDPHSSSGVPAIHRLTGSVDDYKALRKGITALHYELADPALPLHDPANLYRSNVRLAVLKKNSTVLKKLVDDLNKAPGDVRQVPTLIIDDEADQASINTIDPAKNTADRKERTAINQRIADLLELLDRAQYVGYTATPFANVFVDPDDAAGIFPSDFIVSLTRPVGYMGGADFHDGPEIIDDPEASRDPALSNKAAFVRDMAPTTEQDTRADQLDAVDSFVLSGAVKLYRREHSDLTFRHHTMLVHQSVYTGEHQDLADDFRALWNTAGYSSATGLARLERLWENDFAPVSAVRAEPGVPTPASFDDLEPYIGEAIDRISEGSGPVIIVNGQAEKDYETEELDFQHRDVWRILVGGAKLSRGFTVEGLTVSYYSRRIQMADTLMQVGRWFGFRRGYRDLVRLFILRNAAGAGNSHYDMYEAFAAVVRDEEDFRAELTRFSGLNSAGAPMITPRDVPPMVFQQLPWLRPTDRKKMFNAEESLRAVGGQSFSFTMQPPRGDGANNRMHFELVAPILERMTDRDTFEMMGADDRPLSFEAAYAIVDAAEVLSIVERFVWDKNWKFAPHRQAMVEAIESGKLKDFAVLLPQPKTRAPIEVKGFPRPLPVVRRKRQELRYRTGFTGTAVRERDAIEHIAGHLDRRGGPTAERLRTPTRGGMILLFASDPEPHTRQMKRAEDGPVDPGDMATLFAYALPLAAQPTPRIGFTVRRPNGGAIVDAT